MTYIEFFTTTSVENICACLAQAPQRVVLIGDKGKQLQLHARRYEKLLSQRGHKVEFICRAVNKNNMSAILRVLTELVNTYDDCAFGLTGGDELYLVAVGILTARYPEKKLQMHRFNIRNGTVIDCDQDGSTIPLEDFGLSIEENIRIYGGHVVTGKEAPWDMSRQFQADIRAMWEICKENVRAWNTQCGILAAAQGIGKTEDGLRIFLSQSQLKRKTNRRRVFDPAIMKPLEKLGLLKVQDWSGDGICLLYRDSQVRRCLTKAGQVLEMFVYTAAMNARDKDGRIVYQDAMNGVSIDWDGQIQDAGAFDTKNEIDVMLMHGVVPVFISCKNGQVDIDELYKLSSVADRFGGRYAKKVLVATALDQDAASDASLRQRAQDMGIRLLDDLQSCDDGEVNRVLRSLWS